MLPTTAVSLKQQFSAASEMTAAPVFAAVCAQVDAGLSWQAAIL